MWNDEEDSSIECDWSAELLAERDRPSHGPGHQRVGNATISLCLSPNPRQLFNLPGAPAGRCRLRNRVAAAF